LPDDAPLVWAHHYHGSRVPGGTRTSPGQEAEESLKRITRMDLGRDPIAWRRWQQENPNWHFVPLWPLVPSGILVVACLVAVLALKLKRASPLEHSRPGCPLVFAGLVWAISSPLVVPFVGLIPLMAAIMNGETVWRASRNEVPLKIRLAAWLGLALGATGLAFCILQNYGSFRPR
jgi:hypothetical protein